MWFPYPFLITVRIIYICHPVLFLLTISIHLGITVNFSQLNQLHHNYNDF